MKRKFPNITTKEDSAGIEIFSWRLRLLMNDLEKLIFMPCQTMTQTSAEYFKIIVKALHPSRGVISIM